MMNLKEKIIWNIYKKMPKNRKSMQFLLEHCLNLKINLLLCSNFHKIYRQPKLFESAFSSTNNLNDFLIWNKLIKKELYLYVYELFKKEIYNKKWNYHEDNIWSILTFIELIHLEK